MVRKRAYSSSVNRTMTHFFAGSALGGLPGFPCLLREIRSSIVSIFAWRRRSPSVLNVDRYPADYNAIILSFWLSGERGSDLGLFHKAKLPRGIIGCMKVRDANHCHTDANHCHGQNITGYWGWNIHGLSVKDIPRGKVSFRVVYVSTITQKNKFDKWCATFFPSTDSNCLVIFGCAYKQVSQRIFCTKEWSLTAANHGNNWQNFYGIERGRRPLGRLIPLFYVAYVYEERVVSQPRFEMEQATECSSYLVITVRKPVWFSSENRNIISPPFVGAVFESLLLFFCP